MSDDIPAAPWWRSPIGVGLLGLLVMVGGWKLSTWTPRTPHEEEQARKLDEIYDMADGQLRKRLDEIAWRVQRPPYQSVGRLAVFAGAILFAAAGVRMYRAPAPVEPPLTPVEEEAASGE